MNRTFCNRLVFSLFIGFLSVQSANALNLKQKKFKADTEKKVEEYLVKIDKSCGCRPKMNIDWDSLITKNDFRIPYKDMKSVSEAMVKLCKNYKKEVCAGVKGVTTGKIDVKKLPRPTLNNGDIKLGRKIHNQGWDEYQIKKMLEENL